MHHHAPSWSFSLYPFGDFYESFFCCTDDHRRIETRLAKTFISHQSVNRSVRVHIVPKINKVEHNSANQKMPTKSKLKAYRIIRLFLFSLLFQVWCLFCSWNTSILLHRVERVKLSIRQKIFWKLRGVKAERDPTPKDLLF